MSAFPDDRRDLAAMFVPLARALVAREEPVLQAHGISMWGYIVLTALAEISPVLRFPAAQAIGFHFIDYVVHGWDVARSLGLAYQPEADVLAAALPVAQAVPGGQARTREGAPFAPGLLVSAQAGLLDRIVAMLGRSPTWPELP